MAAFYNQGYWYSICNCVSVDGDSSTTLDHIKLSFFIVLGSKNVAVRVIIVPGGRGGGSRESFFMGGSARSWRRPRWESAEVSTSWASHC